MNQIVTKGIVLSRTDFGEADRIITILTPSHGKVRLMVKGARKLKSKLAGGIELFSISDISYLPGKGDIGRLISSRLIKYFDTIVQDINRTMYGYEVLKIINRVTEDLADDDYFNLLETILAAIDNNQLSLEVIRLWQGLQLLKIAGHTPNLITDVNGEKLSQNKLYGFNLEDMIFINDGNYSSKHIKLLRLAISLSSPRALNQVENVDLILPECLSLVQSMMINHIRV